MKITTLSFSRKMENRDVKKYIANKNIIFHDRQKPENLYHLLIVCPIYIFVHSLEELIT